MAGVELNDNLREITISLMGEVPVAGPVLGVLLTVIWKEEDAWTTLREKVEGVVENKIADNELRLLQEDLDGIRDGLKGLKAKFTENNWRNNFNDLNRRTSRFLGTHHDENYQLLMLPQAALFGVIFINLWKLGKSQNWLSDDDTVAVNNFYTKLKDSAFKQYNRKIDEIKKRRDWGSDSLVSTRWKIFADLHNMFVSDIYPPIDMIDTVLNNKSEIYNKYEFYSPPIGLLLEQFEDIPINFKGKTIKKLAVRHGEFIDGLHIWYSDGSETSIGSSTDGEVREFDLTGRYISRIDFYGFHEHDTNDPIVFLMSRMSVIKSMTIYFVDFIHGNHNSDIPQTVDLGGERSSNLMFTKVEFKNCCISWIDGNKGIDGNTLNLKSYCFLALRIGLIPLSEYKKLLNPTPLSPSGSSVQDRKKLVISRISRMSEYQEQLFNTTRLSPPIKERRIRKM